MEPFFRLDLVLHEGRSDMLTVTERAHRRRPRRLRDHGRALDTAARACDAVAAPVRHHEPHLAAYNLLRQRAGAARRRAGARGASPTSSPFASSCCSPPASRRTWPRAPRAASATTSAASPAPRAAWCARPARPGPSRSPTRRTPSSSPPSVGRWPRRRWPASALCAKPSARSPTPSSITGAYGGGRRSPARMHGHGDQVGLPILRGRQGRCATCSAARAPTSRR